MEIHTERLHLRQLELSDAPFILELLNEPGWLEFIGDRNIRNIEDAEQYILTGPQASYANHGFGLLLIIERSSNQSIGMAGLLQRDHLDAPDLGFALLASSEGKGYAYEASEAILKQAFQNHKRPKIWAFTKPTNSKSQNLLVRLGFVFCENDQEGEAKDALYLNEGQKYR